MHQSVICQRLHILKELDLHPYKKEIFLFTRGIKYFRIRINLASFSFINKINKALSVWWFSKFSNWYFLLRCAITIYPLFRRIKSATHFIRTIVKVYVCHLDSTCSLFLDLFRLTDSSEETHLLLRFGWLLDLIWITFIFLNNSSQPILLQTFDLPIFALYSMSFLVGCSAPAEQIFKEKYLNQKQNIHCKSGFKLENRNDFLC